MIIRSKMFKFSSLCVIGTLTIIVNRFMPVDIGQKASEFFANSNKSAYETQTTASGNASSEKSTDNETSESSENVKQVSQDTETQTQAVDEKTSTEKETKEEETQEKEEKTINNVIPDIKGITGKTVNLEDYNGLVIANVEGYLNVREGAGTDCSVIAKMPPNAGGFIEETKTVDGVKWYKIKSGDIEGYVSSEYLITGDEALAMIVKVGRYVINVDCDVLNVREKASTQADILYQISKGEELEVVGVDNGWVEVNVDIGQETAFVSEEYVKVSFELEKAVKIDDMLVGYSTLRTAMVQYAKQFLGNPYVYGGTSLTNGIDCSAFVQAIYKKYNYSLPRTAAAQSKEGTSITSAQLQPGDLVFYAKNGSVTHVTMYIGGGKIIHASNPSGGIKISNVNYVTPYKYVNIIGDL